LASALRCERMVGGYAGREVLTNIGLEFEQGAVTAVLGPNGSGKSTLLKTLSGLIPPLGGEVYVGESPLGRMAVQEVARQIAVVPQEETIPFRFSVREIVLMGRIAWSSGLADTPEDVRIAEEAMRFADCLPFAERAINELSGGEKQRVLIARALAQETPILLLDEPTTHLDITHQIEICRLIRALSAQGKTIVAAMHDLNMVGLMADQAILLGSGGVRLAGSVAEVLNSAELDHVYAVPFDRIERGGRTILLPPLSN